MIKITNLFKNNNRKNNKLLINYLWMNFEIIQSQNNNINS